MEKYYNNIEELRYELVIIKLMNQTSMAVRMINFNATHILVENSKGFRSLIDRDEIVSICKIRPANELVI